VPFLKIMAEAVNAVAEWPNEHVWVADEPARLCIGYQVADERWTCSIHDLKREMQDIYDKLAQLNTMAAGIKLPLRAYPEQVREREILARRAVLRAAVHFTNVEMRQETAKWLTFLGRLRADPSGRLIMGDPDEEPVPEPRPRAYILRA
jgi:hypothetical protein